MSLADKSTMREKISASILALQAGERFLITSRAVTMCGFKDAQSFLTWLKGSEPYLAQPIKVSHEPDYIVIEHQYKVVKH